jgi:peptide subunit release factor 1 (eRF1)
MGKEYPKGTKYKTKCFTCGIEFITQSGTANEGQCYNCRICNIMDK